MNDAQLIKIRIDARPVGKFITALTAAVQVPAHPALDEVVDLPEFSPAVAQFEVVLPAHQMLIELLDQFAHRLETLLRPRYASVRHSHPHASQELVLRNAIVGTYDTLPTSETSRTRSG